MSVLKETYTDLDHALDDVRATLADWVDARANGDPRAETIHHARLVLQEWIANLLRHAHFEDDAPVIHVHLRTDGRDLHCVVRDNSDGFDFENHLSAGPPDSDDLPEGGMGLHIIDACTGALSYAPREDGHYCLTFSIPDDHDPWLSTPF